MRKTFTLFLMSMFFALSAAMAQGKDEPKDFNSPEVYPNNGAQVTTVYNIRLVFSKNVTVTLPEAGIDVVNTETKEVVKIASSRVDEWEPNAAVFLFEQVKVEGKDGKEEMRDQWIETPGVYTYTIPAGVIKSVDGDVFPEATYTFSVVGTFEIEGYSPATTDKLEKIVLTFGQEIEEIKMPNGGMAVVDNYWTPVANVTNATLGEDKKSVTLELDKAITTPGMYNLDIYQGVFVSKSGVSQYRSLTFNVVDSNPSFDTNYENGDKVEEIGDLEITFNNVKEVKLVAETISLYLPGGGEAEGKAVLENNKIVVSFGQKFTEQGEYLFFIPAGAFTMDGVANEEREISVTLFTFTITPLEVLSVVPEVGEIDTLKKITIGFNQPVQLSYDENWQQISREITLTCGDQNYTLTYSPNYSASTSDKLEYLVNAEWNGYEYVSTPITVAGEYTLDLSQIVVDYAAEAGVDEWGYSTTIWHSKSHSCAGVYSWTVTGGTAIRNITNPVDGESVIYDLLGRRVSNISHAGIYIVNGKKMIVK